MAKGNREGLVGAARPGNVMQAAGLHSGTSVLCASVGTAWRAAAHCASSAALSPLGSLQPCCLQ